MITGAAVGAAVALGSLTLVACGGDSATTTPATTAPAPVETTSTQATAGATVSLTGGATVLILDKATGKALTAAGISVAPAGKAEATDVGIAFTVTGDAVEESLATGTVTHTGGLTFSNDKGTSLTVSDFSLDLGSGVITATTDDGATIPLLNTDESAAQLGDGSTGMIEVANVSATLTKEAAQALNDTFSTDIFTADMPVGRLDLALQK